MLQACTTSQGLCDILRFLPYSKCAITSIFTGRGRTGITTGGRNPDRGRGSPGVIAVNMGNRGGRGGATAVCPVHGIIQSLIITTGAVEIRPTVALFLMTRWKRRLLERNRTRPGVYKHAELWFSGSADVEYWCIIAIAQLIYY